MCTAVADAVMASVKMKLVVSVALSSLSLANSFVAPSLQPPRAERGRVRSRLTSTRPTSAEGWVILPVNPSAGDMSRTISFSPSGFQDLQRVKQILRQDKDDDACVVVIPSWRHHVVQYDRLSAAFEALNIPTAVHPLPDGLWAHLLGRLKVHVLRRASRNGLLKETVENALVLPFDHLDSALRAHSRRNQGRRIVVIASDDSAWLIKAFVNSRSAEWHAEVPLEAAVMVGGYHKSIVGGLALDVYPQRPRFQNESKESSLSERRVKFYGLNGREGGRVGRDDEMVDIEASISCMSLEEDSESCVLQEYETERQGWLSLMESTSLLSLWVPRVLRG